MQVKNTYCRNKTVSTLLITVAVLLLFAVFFSLFPGCGVIDKIVPEENAASSTDSQESAEQSGILHAQDTREDLPGKDSLETAGQVPESSEDKGIKYNSALKDYDTNPYGIKELERQREYFVKGVEALEIKDYVIAEYYFNQVKDTYFILQDHIIYYLAKSLLMRQKFDYAQENYLRLRENFPDSIFSEKASIEYADLFFMQEQYLNAQEEYKSFIKNYSKSLLVSYSIFQLAVCQQKNENLTDALENYKKIWLLHPESEYAGSAYSAMQSIIEKNPDMKFDFTNDQIYRRGERFFELYMYKSAIPEFMKVLENLKSSGAGSALEAKTLFKLGMCYFNLRDYKSAKDYLLACYNLAPPGSFADDSLYFLGRTETNLDRRDSAISNYEKLLKSFPQSNYADDALYRMGRIYFLAGDLENAAKSYQKIADIYPSGDKINDAYWELGWIHYKSQDYSASLNTFKNMSAKFKGSNLGEKAMFWQAKSLEKAGNVQDAVLLYKEIAASKNYSYYIFAAKDILEKKGIAVSIGSINNNAQPDNQQIKKYLPEIYDNLFNEDNSDLSESGTEDTGTASEIEESINTGDFTETGSSSGETANKVFNHTSKAKELLIIGFYSSADIEIEAAVREYEDDEYGLLQISTLYLMAKDYTSSQRIVAKNYSKLISNLQAPYKDYLHYLMYPYGFKEYVDKYSSQFGVDPLFILAVMREESRYNPDAGSHAGALGLMQVMPATGKEIANALGIKNFSDNMLYDPETSIKMGAYYLARQLESFGQSKYYACGAYNGGPGAMNRWINNFGDRDIDEFIEHITYEETRNYVKKVMGSYYFYKMLYG
ncbi:MAG: tetratricopeptide repeat protein [Actinobacteria bacterium]|nr:tetratricopeptide repeat protein [Actinomycetota bacterium]